MSDTPLSRADAMPRKQVRGLRLDRDALAVIPASKSPSSACPSRPGLLVSVLVVLSLCEFMFVIFYFMHLRWTKSSAPSCFSSAHLPRDDVGVSSLLGASVR